MNYQYFISLSKSVIVLTYFFDIYTRFLNREVKTFQNLIFKRGFGTISIINIKFEAEIDLIYFTIGKISPHLRTPILASFP
jgi:hypothetical protein